MMHSGDTQPLAPLIPQSPSLAPDDVVPQNRTLAYPKRRRPGRWFAAGLALLILMAAAVIFGIMALVYLQARTDEARPVDAIVVMGAAQYNGRPSPVFEARLQHALALYEQGLAPVIVVTGGKQPGDAYTEAEAATGWLVDRGVPEGAILIENEGRSTWDSIRGVPAVLPADGETSVLVVSDGFHLLRSEVMLRNLGYHAYSSAAPGSPIEAWTSVELGYVIRETGGVLAFLPTMVFD